MVRPRHHATLINCALACYLRTKNNVADVTENYVPEIALYRNDPSLPPHMQFEPRGRHFTPKQDPTNTPSHAVMFAAREQPIKTAKMEFGKDLWGVGGYMLMIKFADGPLVGAIPFWKHFGIDKWRGNARIACKHPWDQFKKTAGEGKKPRFCCGKIEGLPTCCCGGWTHELNKNRSS